MIRGRGGRYLAAVPTRGTLALVTAAEILGLGAVLLAMFAGLLGSVLPGLPGTPLVLAAAIIHRLCFGAHSAGTLGLAALVGLTLLSFALDYLATVYGARRMGATWRGVLGAVLGGLVGVFFGPLGILVMPFLGAVAFELAGGRKVEPAARAGGGAVLGLVLGTVGKVACTAAMIALFVTGVLWNTLRQ